MAYVCAREDDEWTGRRLWTLKEGGLIVEKTSVSTVKRGPYAKTRARRAEITRAALLSFAEHGYERASLRDIAARVGTTHGGLLHHFSSKEELLLAALADFDENERGRAAAAREDSTGGPAVVRMLLEASLDDPEYLRAWMTISVAAADPRHPAHEYFAGRLARARAQFRVDPREGVEFDRQTRATLLIAMLDGLRLQWLINPETNIADPLDQFTTWLLPPEPAAGDEADADTPRTR
jgi:AcrR family transcriptional regulator